MKTVNSNNAEVGVDSQPINGTAVVTTALSSEGTLNFGAPVFTATSSMNQAVVVKGQDIRGEKWKGTATEHPVSTSMQLELSPGFVGPEPIYFVTPDYMNEYMNQVFPEPMTNGDTIQYGAGNVEPPSPVNGDASSNPTEAPSTEELKRMIRQQFEYYFSRDNLVNDTYLVSQMDNDKFVPIATVARFNQIKKLTSDLALIAEALKDSQHIQLDENGEKVRANVKRCIIILREIPDSTPVQEIEALFDSPNCPKYTNCEFAHNNSWYVTFDTEESAQKAFRYLREEVKTFHGKPIMARIKAKTLMSRSTLMRPPSTGQASASQGETSPQPPPQPVFSQRPFNTFSVPTPVMAGQQAFPYYPPGTILQATWIEPRQQFFPPEIIQSSPSFVKPITLSGPRQFFTGNKQRMQTKNFVKADSDRLGDKEERSASTGGPRRPGSYRGSGNGYNQKDNDIYMKRMHQARSKREEVVPRFQRLRERERKLMEQNNSLENEINNLNIDLAPENFPALPSPSSPNDRQMHTATLKDLATNVLQHVEMTEEAQVQKTEESPSEVPHNGQATTPPPCRTPPLQDVNASMRPSYAQIAQKPKLSSASKSPTETTNGKEVRKSSSKHEETQKSSKNNNQKGNNEEKEYQRKDADVADKSGLTAKTQKQMRDSRSLSDSGTRNTKVNSYSGQASGTAKESYASKPGANTNSLGTANRPPAGNTTQTQNKSSKPNSAKVANEAVKAQKETEANPSSAEEVQSTSDEPVLVGAEENNNVKGDDGDHVKEH